MLTFSPATETNFIIFSRLAGLYKNIRAASSHVHRPGHPPAICSFLQVLGLCCILTMADLQAQQNLVPDPHFSVLSPNRPSLDKTISPSLHLLHWQEVARGETGFVHEGSQYHAPNRNTVGKQAALEGNSYVWFKAAGFRLAGEDFGDINRYYLQTRLTESLQAGKRYRCSFNISLADRSRAAISDIGFCLTDTLIPKTGDAPALLYQQPKYSSNGCHLDFMPTQAHIYMNNKGDNILDNDKEWTELVFDFTAKGGEKVLIIGCFEVQRLVQKKILPKTRESGMWIDAYYYLDNISLTAIEEEDNAPQLFVQAGNSEALYNELSSGAIVELPDVLFNTGSAAFTTQAQSVLDTIALVLQQNPDWQIDIDGHTDNVGDSLANIRLSQLRAEAMAQALLRRGIAPARLRARGWGSSMPLAPNNTRQGRQRNWRVSLRRSRD